MRHGMRSQRLSMPTEHKEAMLGSLVKSLIVHGQIRTTLARAKEAQRMADRLVTLGKEGSIHARRRAFRVLQDLDLVKQLFSDIAPRFTDAPGGYTRVLRLSYRRGDGAQLALLGFSRLPVDQPSVRSVGAAKSAPTPEPPTSEGGATPEGEQTEPSKGFLEGLRKLWTRKKKA